MTRLTQRVRENIAKAAQLLADGTPMNKVAEALGVTDRAVEYWRRDHREIWNADFQKAVEGTIERVRKDAGTNRIVDDPDEYMRLALAADKWTADNDQQLFPQGCPDISLTAFYRVYYVQQCMGVVAEESKRQYDIALKLWARITGDPPLRLIRNQHVARFRDTLLQLRGRGDKPYSPNTVRSKMVMIQAILDAAGPAGPRHRDAAGILARVPYAKRPPEQIGHRHVISSERLKALYDAAAKMKTPRVLGIPPATWWRSLLAVALNTALRRGSLLKLRWEYVDLAEKRIVFPAAVMKARRGHLVPLNQPAVDHLERMRSDHEFVFPFPYTAQSLMNMFSVLQTEAGIPEDQQFGFHSIRRTAATLLWKHSPQAARLVLGHHSAQITQKFYVEPEQIGREALADMPQRWLPGEPGPRAPVPIAANPQPSTTEQPSMQCPSCKTKLPAAGEVLVDGRALGVYQCPTCIRLWKLGASQFATALTFAVTSNGDLLDPESLLPIDRSELRTTKGETDDDRGN